jgi:membrane-associated phospholipid phosphatase
MLLKTLKNNAYFLLPYLIILLALIPILFLYSKPEIHLWINQYNSPFCDGLFKYLTFLGDGVFVIVPAIILLFYSLRHFVLLAMAYLSTGLITQVLKRLVFDDIMRPSKYFNDPASLHLIDGVKMLSSKSFPSGHSTSAFAFFLCLALISGNRYIKLLCFAIACLVAFSRVYLSQHFLIDIIAGSMIGTLGTLACYQVLYRNDHKWYAWSLQKLYKHDATA